MSREICLAKVCLTVCTLLMVACEEEQSIQERDGSPPVGGEGSQDSLTVGDADLSIGMDVNKISVEGKGQVIKDGDSTPESSDGTDWGTVAVGKQSKQVFTIRNLSATISLQLTGAIGLSGSSAFTISQQISKNAIGPGNSADFTVTFQPAAAGLQTATISIPNNSGQNPYTFAIRGVGLQATFTPFADSSTVALWLFDEKEYPYITLTEASINEYDLRLMKGGKLVPGKWGNALKVTPGSPYMVSYAGWPGAMINEFMKAPKGQPSGLWGPTGEPRKILNTLVSGTFTLELWLKLAATPKAAAVILDLGDALLPGLTLSMNASADSLILRNDYIGEEITCPTSKSTLTDLNWHHLALVVSGGTVVHYLDGKKQAKTSSKVITKQTLPPDSQPKDMAFETRGFKVDSKDDWRRQHRFNLSLGESRQNNMEMAAWIDELRLSDTVRYQGAFAPPTTFSRNYSKNPPQAAVPTGPPLLFAKKPLPLPVPLGSRRHLFIDEVLVKNRKNVVLKVNPVNKREDLTLTINGQTKLLKEPQGMPRETVYDHQGKVYLFMSDGYSSREGITHLFTSTNGINFTAPNLGVINYKGSMKNNYIMYRKPMGSVVFKDDNPNINPEERFIITAWTSNRGIYLYVSPDGLHWRRNETLMLPVASGGDAESYWDDQRGVYVTFLKRDSGSNTPAYPGYGKRGIRFASADPYRNWPMKVLSKPYFEGWPFPMLSGEGPISFPIEPPIIPFILYYDIYRTRAIKYRWAPDTYVAFYWAGYHNQIFDGDENNKRRRVRLAISRDGENWTYHRETWYIPSVGKVNNIDVRDSMTSHGLIRRNDELWHYTKFSTKNNGNGKKGYSRIKQRLDGFVSLDANSTVGTVETHPLTFSGNKLLINAKITASAGKVRVALLDAAGTPHPGFSLKDCVPFTGDAVNHQISWGKANPGSLAGKTVKLHFELKSAKLYAFQFSP